MRMIFGAVLTLLLLTVGAARAADLRYLPDPVMTPGVANPAVTQDNIHETICVSGWTKTVRPPVSYTNKLKREQMEAYGYAGMDPRSMEEDHAISIELGGSPTDPKNLWPEPWDGEFGAHKKDVVETALKRLVCSGAMTLAEAQHEISTDWIAAYKRLEPAAKE